MHHSNNTVNAQALCAQYEPRKEAFTGAVGKGQVPPRKRVNGIQQRDRKTPAGNGNRTLS